MRLRKIFRRIHRWVGITVSLWLILLATTGVLLQHSQDWGLDKTWVSNHIILKSYGIAEHTILFEKNSHNLVQIDKQIFINESYKLSIGEKVVSALSQSNQWVIATNSQLIWIDFEGNILQTLDELDGLKVPIKKLGTLNNKIIYQSKNFNYSLDNNKIKANDLKWSLAANNSRLLSKSINLASHEHLNYEKLLFDLHAGITTSKLINDLAAIGLIFLSFSGLFIFFKKKRKKLI